MPAKRQSTRAKSSLAEAPSAPMARKRGRSLCSQSIGALPILNRRIERTRLENFLRAALPAEGRVATRFDLAYRIDDAGVAADATSDGVFPLVTNVSEISALELLQTYKRQPAIEKRFSQLKTDFEVAPEAAGAIRQGLRGLTCHRREIQGK